MDLDVSKDVVQTKGVESWDMSTFGCFNQAARQGRTSCFSATIQHKSDFRIYFIIFQLRCQSLSIPSHPAISITSMASIQYKYIYRSHHVIPYNMRRRHRQSPSHPMILLIWLLHNHVTSPSSIPQSPHPTPPHYPLPQALSQPHHP